jgi:hypothetical protein
MRLNRLVTLSLFALLGAGTALCVGPSFVPDVTFHAETLAGWHTVGNAQWRVENGEIVGKPTAPGGGWLVLDKSFQDVGLYVEFRCSGGCKTGVLFRETKSSKGTKGTFVDLADPDIQGYSIAVGADGSIGSREKALRGGGLVRFTPPPNPNAPQPNPRPQLPAPGDLPFQVPDTGLKAGEWNTAEMFMDANVLRTFLNDGREHGAVTDETYGPLALYIGGTGEVRFRNVKYKDLSMKVREPEKLSPNFRKQVLTDFFYSFSVASADFNKDGVPDIISGPFIYYGPDYTRSEEIYPAEAFNQTSGFAGDAWIQSAADFTGDGWPDVISTNYGALGVTLYVNPGADKNRRWDKYPQVVKEVQSEVATLRDVDGDGKPEIVYMGGGQVRYAKPDPAHPTGPWIVKDVSEKGYGAAHGIGVGDINGDGRMDIVAAYGWWEGPKEPTAGTWKYHPSAFGRYGRGIMGGAEMGVYDVNGDGLADVVTALNAHGWGLAWFEQKRDAQGTISFVQHMISDDLNSQATNAGGVVFSEPHAAGFADVNGDKIPDFIVGKRYLSHVNTFLDPDPFGQPVLYVYKVVRDKKAPGGARFVPELIHNESGVGSQVLAVDLNHDGAVDIISPGRFGTVLFWGKAH